MKAVLFSLILLATNAMAAIPKPQTEMVSMSRLLLHFPKALLAKAEGLDHASGVTLKFQGKLVGQTQAKCTLEVNTNFKGEVESYHYQISNDYRPISNVSGKEGNVKIERNVKVDDQFVRFSQEFDNYESAIGIYEKNGAVLIASVSGDSTEIEGSHDFTDKCSIQ